MQLKQKQFNCKYSSSTNKRLSTQTNSTPITMNFRARICKADRSPQLKQIRN